MTDTPFTIQDFAPAPDGRYSPNLHRWAARFMARGMARALLKSAVIDRPQILLPSRDVLTGDALRFSETMNAMRCLIGYYDPNDRSVFIGARLAMVLTDPFPSGADVAPMHVYAHVAPHVRDGSDVTDWFWPAYRARGRCVFDPCHAAHFLGDGGRFRMPNRQMRTCNWCGAQHLAEIRERTVTDTFWREVA